MPNLSIRESTPHRWCLVLTNTIDNIDQYYLTIARIAIETRFMRWTMEAIKSLRYSVLFKNKLQKIYKS